MEKTVDILLRHIFKDKIKERKIEISDDSSLLNYIGLTSLDIMEAAMECEHKFNIKLKNTEIVRCRTFGQFKQMIIKNIEQQTKT